MNRNSWVSQEKIVREIRNDDAELKELVYIAMGEAASIHWRASGEVFNSEEVSRIGEELLTNIKRIR